MHLEDRLQEMYLKSKMLSEYLRGHTRVHVKELGVVLGWVPRRATISPCDGAVVPTDACNLCLVHCRPCCPTEVSAAPRRPHVPWSDTGVARPQTNAECSASSTLLVFSRDYFMLESKNPNPTLPISSHFSKMSKSQAVRHSSSLCLYFASCRRQERSFWAFRGLAACVWGRCAFLPWVISPPEEERC